MTVSLRGGYASHSLETAGRRPGGITHRGTWSSTATYAANEAVTHNGAAWRALRTNINVTPVEGLDWTLFAGGGATGDFMGVSPAGVKTVISSTQPTTPGAGDLWIDPSETAPPSSTTFPTRQQTTYSTASLAAGAYEFGRMVITRGYRLYQISTSRPARVRLYTTAAKRDADVNRTSGTDPGANSNSGLLLDFTTTATLLAADLSPIVDGANMESPVVENSPITVTNLDTVAGTVAVTFTYLRTE